VVRREIAFAAGGGIIDTALGILRRLVPGSTNEELGDALRAAAEFVAQHDAAKALVDVMAAARASGAGGGSRPVADADTPRAVICPLLTIACRAVAKS
jgi:hypothetical protein